jgi:PadR family transcriptional regulator, regulatory protein PadR
MQMCAFLGSHKATELAKSNFKTGLQGTFLFLWRNNRKYGMLMCEYHRRNEMGESKLDLLQGTLDLMVLQTLATMGEMHGYGIARRIEQVSGDEVLLNQGTIYASLVRLQHRGWISAEWGTSENNRKAKFYSITKRGRKQMAEDAAYWLRLSGVMGRVLAMGKEGGE